MASTPLSLATKPLGEVTTQIVVLAFWLKTSAPMAQTPAAPIFPSWAH